MKIAIPMSVAVLLWSLYPLMSSWALETIDPFSLMLIVQFIAFHGAILLALIALFRKGQIFQYLDLQKSLGFDGILLLIVAGACSAFSHVFFVMALGMANKNGISLIFEVWPLLAMFFAPHMIERDWESLRKKDYIIGLIALFGVCLVILSDENINWFANETWTVVTVIAYFMTILASYMTAMLSLQRAQYAHKLASLKNSFAAVMIAEAGTRFIAVIFILIAAFGLQSHIQIPDTKSLGLLAFIGIGVFSIGGSCFTYCLIRAKHPNVSLFYYFVPILAILWLVLSGETTVTVPLLIGGTITIGSCIYLMLEPKASNKA